MAEVAVEGVVVPADATPQTRPDLFGTRGQLRADGDGGITSAMMADKPEYATPSVSGINSGFYVEDRGLPWHVTLARQLGEADLMAGQQTLLRGREAVQAAGGDYTVELRPITVQDTDIVIPNKYAAVRTDTGAALGIVGRSYKTLQNQELVDFCDMIVDSGEAKYETGGVMRDGAWFFISMELNGLEIEIPGDMGSLKWFLLAHTSHDGSRPAGWYITQVRTVCKNTENLATAGAVTQWRLRHSGSIDGKLLQVRAALNIAFKNRDIVRDLTTGLSKTKLVDRQVREIFEKAIWPVKAETGDAEVERQTRHSEKAFENYMTSETLEGIRGTAWGAYNAVTEYLDFLVPYRSKVMDVSEARATSLLFGGDGALGVETKQRALRVLAKAGSR